MEKKQTAVEWYIEQHNELLKLYNNSNMTALDLALAEDKLKFRAKQMEKERMWDYIKTCLLYTSPSPRDGATSRMPSSA